MAAGAAAGGRAGGTGPRGRSLVLASMMLAMFMAAVEGTIVSTAMPSIVADLGGFAHYSWVFSLYLLGQGATVPLYGKLADLYGRRPALTAGILLFLTGSVLCGLAPSMGWLILFRGLQGLGAAAILPLATTVVGDLYTLEERARVQGYLSSVWGFSAIVGPLLGGFLVQGLSWRWVFFVNLPVGLLTLAGLHLFLHERVERRREPVDLAGSALLVGGGTLLMLGLLQGGVGWPWLSAPSLLVLAGAAAALLLFARQERRARTPFFPVDLLKNRTVAASNAGVFLVGALTFGPSSFVPAFVQGVLGEPPAVAGLTLGGMSIGWPLASSLSGFAMLRWGFRNTALLGTGLALLGTTLLSLAHPGVSFWFLFAATVVLGLGQGLTSTTYIVAVQSSVGWEKRGVATGANSFSRLLGGMIGVAVMGTVLNGTLLRALGRLPPEVLPPGIARTLDVAGELLDPAVRAGLAPATLEALSGALALGLRRVFVILVAAAALEAWAILAMPRGPARQVAPPPPDGLRGGRGGAIMGSGEEPALSREGGRKGVP